MSPCYNRGGGGLISEPCRKGSGCTYTVVVVCVEAGRATACWVGGALAQALVQPALLYLDQRGQALLSFSNTRLQYDPHNPAWTETHTHTHTRTHTRTHTQRGGRDDVRDEDGEENRDGKDEMTRE